MRITNLYVGAFLLVIFFNSCNEDERSNTEVIERHPNGTIKKEVVWESKMDSVYVERTYYDNGQLKFYITYNKGIKDGFVAFFWNTGEVRGLWAYSNGKEIKPTTGELYKNGQPMLIRHFDESETGKKVNYYENGQISNEEYLDHGKPVGVWKRYDEKGNLLKSDTFSIVE